MFVIKVRRDIMNVLIRHTPALAAAFTRGHTASNTIFSFMIIYLLF